MERDSEQQSGDGADNGPQMRVSDAERDAVVDRLNEGMVEGRLTVTEFEDRTKQAYRARYVDDLELLTADLPTLPVVAQPGLTPALRQTTVRASNVQQPQQSRKRRRWFLQLMGGADRSGRWDPRDGVMSVTLMGGQVIDLTEIDATEVTINAITVMGATDIIVPDGAIADLSGLIILGGSSNETTPGAESSMRVHVRSFGMMGACDVRNLSKRERKKRLGRAE